MSRKGAQVYLESIASETVAKGDQWKGAKTWFKKDEKFLMEQLRWAHMARASCPRMDLYEDLEEIWPDTKLCKQIHSRIADVLQFGLDVDEQVVDRRPYGDDEDREKGKTLDVEKLGEETAAFLDRRSASLANHALNGKLDVKEARAYCWLIRDRSEGIRSAIEGRSGQ